MQIRKGVLIFIIIAASLCCYFNAFFATFVWDDTIFITPNPYMQSFRFLPQFFVHDFWQIGIRNTPSQYYRPLLAASFMLDFSLWKSNAFGFHLSNIVYHILTSIILFLFLESLLKNRVIAFFSALIFSVHPVHAEVVSFISGRVDSVPLVFFLLSLFLFVQFAHRNKGIFYVGSLVCFFLSLLSKEMAVTLPLIVLYIDFLFFSHCRVKKVLKNFVRIHLGFFLVLGVYLFLRYAVANLTLTTPSSQGFARNFSMGTHTYWRLFTVIKIVVLYARLVFLPYNLSVEYLFDPANSFFEPIVWGGFVLILVFLFIAIKSARRQPALSFSIGWFFITLLPVSNIFPQGNLFAERYVYTPSVGYCLGVALLFFWLSRQKIRTRTIPWKMSLYILFTAWIMVLGKACYERSAVWQNDFILWNDAVKKVPHSSLAHTNLAYTYLKMNYFDKALQEARESVRLAPLHHQPLKTLGLIYNERGELQKAIGAFRAGINLNPNDGELYNNLAVAYGKNEQYEEAISAGLTALDLNPYIVIAHNNLAISYAKAGRIDEAIESYEKYLAIVPNSPKVHVAVGHLYKRKEDAVNAKRHWRAALKLWENYPPAKEALSSLLEQ